MSGRTTGPIAWMAANPVAANLAMAILLVAGGVLLLFTKQEVFPQFDLDQIQVAVVYPGASPQEVEQGVVLAVEEAVRGLDGVDQVRAVAAEGLAQVTVELFSGADSQKAANDVQQAIDRITSFPQEAERPQVTLLSRRTQVLQVVVHGDPAVCPATTLRSVAEDLRQRLLAHPGITQVTLGVAKAPEIAVEIPAARLREHGLTLEGVAMSIRRSALDLPAGGLKTPSGEMLVRIKDRRELGSDFATIPLLAAQGGGQVPLGAVARIRDGLAETDLEASWNGHPALMLTVNQVGDQKPLSVAKAVQEVLQATHLPPGIGTEVLNDLSDVFSQRMDLLWRNGYIGFLLVVVFLALFLEPRLAFWVSMSIPISFLGAFLVLPFFGVTINMVSLFAFIIALGIVVDDAVVTGENTYEYRKQGMEPLLAAQRGAADVCMPVTFSILTNIVTFLPLFFIPGIMGKVFWCIPAVVIATFAISLFDSLYLMPARLGHPAGPMARGAFMAVFGLPRLLLGADRFQRGLSGFQRGQSLVSDVLTRLQIRLYRPFLGLALTYRYLTVAVCLALIVVVAGYVKSGRMGFSPFPKVEADMAVASLRLPYGAPIAEARSVCERLIAAARQVTTEIEEANPGKQQTRGIFSVIGDSSTSGIMGAAGEAGSHLVSVQVHLIPAEQRAAGTEDFTRRWRTAVGSLPGVEVATFQSDAGGPGAGAALTVELRHAQIPVLEAAATRLARELRDFSNPKVSDVNPGFSPGKVQFDLRLKPAALDHGLGAAEIGRQVRAAFYGAEALRQQRGRDELKVMVRLPEEERQTLAGLEDLLIAIPNGRFVPLSEVASVERGRAYTRISRRNGSRTLQVTADVTPRDQTGLVINRLTGREGPPGSGNLDRLITDHPGLVHSFEGMQADLSKSLLSLGIGLGLSLLGVYVLMAIPLRSYLQPLLIMVSVPFGLVGAVLGHKLLGYSLSIMSMMGIVAMCGVAVNAALLLLVFTGELRQTGLGPREAVIQAATRRLRPISLTTMTTFLGLVPMLAETSRQARFLIPMAISLGCGIIFATVVSLLIVPSLYLILHDLGLGRKGDVPQAGASAPPSDEEHRPG